MATAAVVAADLACLVLTWLAAQTEGVMLWWLNDLARLAARAPRGDDANMVATPPVPVPKKLLPRATLEREEPLTADDACEVGVPGGEDDEEAPDAIGTVEVVETAGEGVATAGEDDTATRDSEACGGSGTRAARGLRSL